MRLTVAIPARNDAPGLLRLLDRLGRLGCAAHVVVVDDGSDRPLEAAALARAAALPGDALTLLRHETPRGPGTARNLALAHVPTDHLLYLDADDLPTAELPPLLADLKGETFDVCLFKHHDTRAEQELAWGQMPWDEAHWQAAGLALGALREATSEATAHLSRTANYPWNKIYRTAFLRERGIGCSEIMVHEDVELHWRSFLHARRILTSDRVAVIHHVAPGGGRLTNRTGPERLEVFAPLARIAAELAAGPPDRQARLAPPFFAFTAGLLDWIEANLDPAHHARFHAAARDWINAHLPEGMADRIAAEDPPLSTRLAAPGTA